MYVPILRKIINRNDALVERVLLDKGVLSVHIGNRVVPFTSLGSYQVSYTQLQLPKNFKPLSSLILKKIKQGTTLGKYKKDYINAPYNGYLERDINTNSWVFKEVGETVQVLAGVWGTVKDIVSDYSVLLEISCKDFLLPVSTGAGIAGELVVFPNPSQLLLGSYFDHFMKSVSGKIFYVGNHISVQTVLKAKELKIEALLGGSISLDALTMLKKDNISTGIFEGFGDLKTSGIIYDELKNLSNRFVFLDPSYNRLRIPVPSKLDQATIKSPLKLIKEGDTVQIFQHPYFGYIGKVDTIKESSILVKVPKVSTLVEIHVPNFFVIL